MPALLYFFAFCNLVIGSSAFVLSGILAEVTAPTLDKPIALNFVRAAADYEQNGWPVAKVLDGQQRDRRNQAGWAVDGPTRREICRAVFALAAPIDLPADAKLRVTLRHDAINGHNIGRFKLYSSALPPIPSLQKARRSPKRYVWRCRFRRPSDLPSSSSRLPNTSLTTAMPQRQRPADDLPRPAKQSRTSRPACRSSWS